jgi:hypothetical protein
MGLVCDEEGKAPSGDLLRVAGRRGVGGQGDAAALLEGAARATTKMPSFANPSSARRRATAMAGALDSPARVAFSMGGAPL